MIAVNLAIQLLLMNCVGIFTRKTGIVDGKGTAQLTDLVMKICIPCLIFHSVSRAAAFSPDLLSNCLTSAGLGGLATALGMLTGQIFYLAHHKNGQGRIWRYGLSFCHFSFMGIPVMDALFGEMGTFYYAFFLIPVRIAYFSLSEKLMTPDGQKGGGKGVGRTLGGMLLTPQMVALYLGLVFWFSGWELPEAIGHCVKSFNTICSPLALLLCGMIVGGYDFKRLLHLEYLWLPLLRTIAMPAFFWGVSRLLMMLGVNDMACSMLVVYSALPVSSLLPVYAVKYSPDAEDHLCAAGVSIVSVLLSAVTIPIWYTLLF